MPHGICHGVQLSLVDIIAADSQGNRSGGFRIDNGPQTALLAEHNQVGVRLRYDGNAAVVVHYLYENSHTASLEETVVSEFLFRGISREELPQTIPDNSDRLAEQAFGLDTFQSIGRIIRRHVCQEPLVIEWNLQKIRIIQRPGQDAHIHFGLP